jgi:hypothetical protein
MTSIYSEIEDRQVLASRQLEQPSVQKWDARTQNLLTYSTEPDHLP